MLSFGIYSQQFMFVKNFIELVLLMSNTSFHKLKNVSNGLY